MTDAYNYRHFPLDLDAAHFDAFADHLHPGDRGPDGPLYDVATGETVSLSDYWKNGPVVVEFGSYS